MNSSHGTTANIQCTSTFHSDSTATHSTGFQQSTPTVGNVQHVQTCASGQGPGPDDSTPHFPRVILHLHIFLLHLQIHFRLSRHNADLVRSLQYLLIQSEFVFHNNTFLMSILFIHPITPELSTPCSDLVHRRTLSVSRHALTRWSRLCFAWRQT